MKLFHTLLYPLLGLLFLSCSDNEQETGDNPAPTTGTITFGVDLTGFTTRVTQDGTSWTNGDQIGTFALDADTFEPVLDNVNVPYVCAEDGQSVAFTSETPLAVQDDGKPVKFVAYYPYNADMQDFNYPVSIADQSNGSTACDLLYGTASEPYVYDKESDTVYVYNNYQLLLIASENSVEEPIMSYDMIPEKVGIGQLLYKDGTVADESAEAAQEYLTYSKEHNYVLSPSFTEQMPELKAEKIKKEATVQADAGQLGGREYLGQVYTKVEGCLLYTSDAADEL